MGTKLSGRTALGTGGSRGIGRAIALVRGVLAELGVKQLFWKVDIKPSGPTAFSMKGETPVFSLPCNPFSTMVTFEEFVRPALLKMMGHRRIVRPFLTPTLMNDARKSPVKALFLRVRIEVKKGDYLAWSSGEPWPVPAYERLPRRRSSIP